jgi:hypothetical protein
VWTAGTKKPVLAHQVQRAFAHAGHDAHRDGDIAAVGDLDAEGAEIFEPSGPMQNGTTYIVRPRMQPSNRPFSRARISTGSAQLLVGPASISISEQMKVRLSTRATSLGSEAA